MKILIVDDRELNRKLLREALSAEGFQTQEAHDGLQALDALKGEKFDLMITDLMMPNLDGFGLCYLLRTRDHMPVPIIVLTATYTNDEEHLALGLGANLYLRKPISLKDIIHEIRVLVARHQAGDLIDAWAHDDELSFVKMYADALARKLAKKVLELQRLGTYLDASGPELRKSHDRTSNVEEELRLCQEKLADVLKLQHRHN